MALSRHLFRRLAVPNLSAVARFSTAKVGLLERLQNGTVIGDGGYLFCLEARGYMQAGPWTPEVVVEHPSAVTQLHTEFKRAGADVLQTLTFYGTADKMARQGQGDKAKSSNELACALANDVAGNDCLVGGTICQCPAGEALRDGEGTEEAVEQQFREQLDLQMKGGIDFIICEYFERLQEALIAVRVAKSYGLPVMTTMAMGPKGDADNVSCQEVAKQLSAHGATIIGTNCFFDPEQTLACLALMKEGIPEEDFNKSVFLGCQPVAFKTPDPNTEFLQLPEYPLAMEARKLGRFEGVQYARAATALGVRYIGGCCGFEPYHMRAISEDLGRTVPASDKTPKLGDAISAFLRARGDNQYWHDLVEGKGGFPTETKVYPRRDV